MEAVYTPVILAILCTSVVCAIGLQTPKSTGGKSKTKERPGLSKGTTCGILANAPNGGRIVGGEEAKPHSWPWQVFIRCMYIERVVLNGSFCGGSIISNKWIITAAHCVDALNTDIRCDCPLFLGKHEIFNTESTQVVGKISDYFIHEKYDPLNPDNGYDLALLKLTKPLKFTDAIQPICLPFGLPELPYEKSCYATGWGITQPDSKMPSQRLMQLSMTVTDESVCQSPIGRIICTVGWKDHKDVCSGDSGGPLACQEQDRKWYLRGVASMASWLPEKCDSFATFTTVTSFEKWIKNITSRN